MSLLQDSMSVSQQTLSALTVLHGKNMFFSVLRLYSVKSEATSILVFYTVGMSAQVLPCDGFSLAQPKAVSLP